jgi:hypothetical protein
METPDLIGLLVAPVHAAGLPYMVVGSVASAHYGEPRFTADVDLALALPCPAAADLEKLYPAPDYYCPPRDVLLVELARQERAHFNIIHLASGLKADFYPSRNQPLFQWAIKNRVERLTPHGPCYFAPPEYVVLWKLIFFREGGSEKHLRDVSGILKVSANQLDRTILDRAIAEQGLQEIFGKAVA